MFTIIVPIYNTGRYLRKCLESVLDQTYGDWECICVDDGSSDGSGNVADEFAARDSRVRVVHQVNAGVSMARNVALEHARGMWTQFLDSDDSLAPDFLERLDAKINAFPDVDAIEHCAVYCYGGGHRELERMPPEQVITGEDVLADPLGQKYSMLARCACYKIFRRSVIESAGLRFEPGVPNGEDWLFATLFYTHANKVLICPSVAGYLRIFRSDSAMATVSAKKLFHQERLTEVLLDAWTHHRTCAFSRNVCVAIMMLAKLGVYLRSSSVRDECIEFLLRSHLFAGRCMWFLIVRGSWKCRVFAGAYLLSPKFVRRRLLQKL